MACAASAAAAPTKTYCATGLPGSGSPVAGPARSRAWPDTGPARSRCAAMARRAAGCWGPARRLTSRLRLAVRGPPAPTGRPGSS